MDIKSLAEQYNDYIIDRRRYYHTCPELSGEEKNTRAHLKEDLEALGITDIHEMETCYGLTATIHGGKPGKTEMLGNIIGPMILLIVVGVIGMVILCFIAAKILKVSFLMATATALTALYGFPPNAIISEATCTALAQTPEEKEFLMSKMFPPMIVGGFTTVTITSVVIAGIFAEMF